MQNFLGIDYDLYRQSGYDKEAASIYSKQLFLKWEPTSNMEFSFLTFEDAVLDNLGVHTFSNSYIKKSGKSIQYHIDKAYEVACNEEILTTESFNINSNGFIGAANFNRINSLTKLKNNDIFLSFVDNKNDILSVADAFNNNGVAFIADYDEAANAMILNQKFYYLLDVGQLKLLHKDYNSFLIKFKNKINGRYKNKLVYCL